LTKTPLIYSISYSNLGVWELCLEDYPHQSAPMVTRLGPELLSDVVAHEISHEIFDWNG